MINKFLIFFLVCFLMGCNPIQKCNINKNYLKPISTKRYSVESKYCISSNRNSIRNKSLLIINIFDRVTGALIKEGVVIPNNDKQHFNSGKAEIQLDNGIYNIGIIPYANGYLPFSIKGLKISSNKIIVVDCYLGSSVQ